MTPTLPSKSSFKLIPNSKQNNYQLKRISVNSFEKVTPEPS